MIDGDGNNLGVLSLNDALQVARDAQLDLVEVGPDADPPVAKVVDYHKWQYQQSKQRQRQRQPVLKEMKYRLKIDGGDFDTKTRRVTEFLAAGNRVKITIMFRGRERSRPESGRVLLDRIAEAVTAVGRVDQPPTGGGGPNMTMVLAPLRH